ncbi:RNA polymerase sigma factor SigY [Paenibacillus caui]|uniref:RNA polymerase sigma factor SigY n=1 Tax=Paenibacillus caui TaxID=2873927 RepID=UPI001CA9A56C|nr:RNA polymerase sigma factor SigY [Paenibacillus caui]
MEQDEDSRLISEAVRGSDEAFAKLFQAHYTFLYRYLIKLTLQPELAEDLVQETMLKAYTHLQHFEGKSKFSTWLISIASRLFIDVKRKGRRDREKVRMAAEDTLRKARWNLMASGQEWTENLELFARLAPGVRTPILLRHYYGFTYSEIAGMLDLKEGTVKTRVHNGLKQIREEFRDDRA